MAFLQSFPPAPPRCAIDLQRQNFAAEVALADSSPLQLRIGAQLSDAQSGTQLWNETFEGDITRLFELQDLVTARIVNSIGPKMVSVAARDSESRVSSPKMADLMMRANALRQKPFSLQNSAAIVSLYRQVLTQEPNNVAAMGSLAGSLVNHACCFR